MARIRHKNVLGVHQIYERGEIDDRIHIITEWVDGLPVELVEQKFDDLDAKGLIHAARATAWAKETAELLGRLTSRLTLDDAAMAKARGVGSVIVPLFRPEGG